MIDDLSRDSAAGELVLQQLTRVRTAGGAELIRGTVVGEFPIGERSATLYVAFCPPFERLPTVEVELVDDLDATIKMAQVLHNGAQFEVRLATQAEKFLRVSVDFVAQESTGDQ